VVSPYHAGTFTRPDAPRFARRTNDAFTVADFFDCLSYTHGELHLATDYIRGRSMKTDVTIRQDGSVTLTTWGRGASAVRWLDQFLGKKRIAHVTAPD